MLKVNTIIKLRNNDSYVILNATKYQEQNYFLIMGLDDKGEVIPTKVLIITETNQNNKTFINIVEDRDTIIKVTELFKEQIV